MEQPQVTAVIPLHNHEKWVKDAINSIVDSDYSKKRLIVVDDGSTDNSFEVVLNLIKNAQKVNLPDSPEPKYLYQGYIRGVNVIAVSFRKAYGPSSARNYGIKCGWDGTDLFAFCDSDDFYSPSKISLSVSRWLRHPTLIGIVYSDYSTLDSEGNFHRQFKEPFSRQRLMQECLPNCDSLMSKAGFEKVGLFDESLRTIEDWDYYLRCSEHFILSHLPLDLLTLRVGLHSSSSVISKENWEKNYRRVFEKLQQRQRS